MGKCFQSSILIHQKHLFPKQDNLDSSLPYLLAHQKLAPPGTELEKALT